MRQLHSTTLQWRAAFAAALLIVIGALLGVSVDRLWLATKASAEHRPQVSVEALSSALNLNARQRDGIAALVDSIGLAISDAIEHNPDSLPLIVRQARARLESAVPLDLRPRFRNWIDGRRSEMLERMRGQDRMRGGRGRGRGLTPGGPQPGQGRGRQPFN